MKGTLCVQGDSPEMPPGGQDALSSTVPGSPCSRSPPSRVTLWHPVPEHQGMRAHTALCLPSCSAWGISGELHAKPCTRSWCCGVRTHAGVQLATHAHPPHTPVACTRVRSHAPWHFACTHLHAHACVHALQAHVCPRMHLAGTLHGECHSRQPRSPSAAPCPLWPSCSLPRPRLNGRKAPQRVRAVGNACCRPWRGHRVLQEWCQADLQLQAHSKACTHAERNPQPQTPGPTQCPRPHDWGAYAPLRPPRGTQHNSCGRARSAGGSSKLQTWAPHSNGDTALRTEGNPNTPAPHPGVTLPLGEAVLGAGGAGRLSAPAVGRPASSDKGTWPYSQFPACWRASAQPR